MSLYGRFEQVVTWILTLFIAVALFRLVTIVLQLLVSGLLNPLSHLEFEVIFGTIMTLLIAMEFNHSILETTIAALAFALIALGALYWLMGERDNRGGAVRQEPELKL